MKQQTQNSVDHFVVYFIISTLEIISTEKTFLLNCEFLKKVNQSIVAKIFNNALYIDQKTLNMITCYYL